MSLLARLGLSARRAADQRDTESDPFAHFNTTSHQRRNTTQHGEQITTGNVLVALHSDELDSDLVRLGCLMAKARKGRVFGIYGVEVPRTLPIDTFLPEVVEKAEQTLERAVELAEDAHCELEPEIVQTRHYGQSLVAEAAAHGCGLIILSVPYRTNRSGFFDAGEAVPYVLRHAPCRVWVIRGQQHGS